jgi:hypothetical protein
MQANLECAKEGAGVFVIDLVNIDQIIDQRIDCSSLGCYLRQPIVRSGFDTVTQYLQPFLLYLGTERNTPHTKTHTQGKINERKLN